MRSLMRSAASLPSDCHLRISLLDPEQVALPQRSAAPPMFMWRDICDAEGLVRSADQLTVLVCDHQFTNSKNLRPVQVQGVNYVNLPECKVGVRYLCGDHVGRGQRGLLKCARAGDRDARMCRGHRRDRWALTCWPRFRAELQKGTRSIQRSAKVGHCKT